MYGLGILPSNEYQAAAARIEEIRAKYRACEISRLSAALSIGQVIVAVGEPGIISREELQALRRMTLGDPPFCDELPTQHQTAEEAAATVAVLTEGYELPSTESVYQLFREEVARQLDEGIAGRVLDKVAGVLGMLGLPATRTAAGLALAGVAVVLVMGRR